MAEDEVVASDKAVVSIVSEFWARFQEEVQKAGGTDADIERLFSPEGAVLLKELAEFLVQKEASRSLDRWRLQKLILAGKYDWVNPHIVVEHFPLGLDYVSSGLMLVHPGKTVTTTEVLAHLCESRLRPAKIRDLLFFGAKNSDAQRTHTIVALGSIWLRPSHVHCCPVLSAKDGMRRLGLDWCDKEREWTSEFRFLVLPA